MPNKDLPLPDDGQYDDGYADAMLEAIHREMAARELSARVDEQPDVRSELVDRVRQQIADGTYETPERIEGAIDGLMEEIWPNGDSVDGNVG